MLLTLESGSSFPEPQIHESRRMSDALPTSLTDCAESVVLLQSIKNQIDIEVTSARKTLEEMLEYLARFRDGACPQPASALHASPPQSPASASTAPSHNGNTPSSIKKHR